MIEGEVEYDLHLDFGRIFVAYNISKLGKKSKHSYI